MCWFVKIEPSKILESLKKNVNGGRTIRNVGATRSNGNGPSTNT